MTWQRLNSLITEKQNSVLNVQTALSLIRSTGQILAQGRTRYQSTTLEPLQQPRCFTRRSPEEYGHARASAAITAAFASWAALPLSWCLQSRLPAQGSWVRAAAKQLCEAKHPAVQPRHLCRVWEASGRCAGAVTASQALRRLGARTASPIVSENSAWRKEKTGSEALVCALTLIIKKSTASSPPLFLQREVQEWSKHVSLSHSDLVVLSDLLLKGFLSNRWYSHV